MGFITMFSPPFEEYFWIFFQPPREFLLPPKIKMTMENEPFEAVLYLFSPIKTSDFPIVMLYSFRGCMSTVSSRNCRFKSQKNYMSLSEVGSLWVKNMALTLRLLG